MTDFIIIGGGVAGLSAGAHLAPHGRVTLIEAETQLGHHASSRSAAMHIPSYGAGPVKAISEASTEAHLEAGVLTPRAVMLVGRPEDSAGFEAECAALRMTRIDGDEARRIVPLLSPEVTLTAITHDAWDIDTDALLQRYARSIRETGTIVTGKPVTAIEQDEGLWRVTAGETFAAPVVVNAAGPWADVVAGLAGIAPIGFVPLRRSMARIGVPGGYDARDWPMLIGAAGDWYAKPDAGALIVSPSEEDLLEPHDAWADDMVLAEGLAAFEEDMTAPVERMIANWAGLRTFAPDRLLVIGPEPDAPGFYWMAGQGGYGFQSAAAAGRLLAARVLGQTPDLDTQTADAFLPSRFR
ncbi:FAD-binding oxidoreductase [Maritimibacter sp. DP1N21-5]|uniref:NAD(P)/FAD-dependent oxidoreductase n=1 Tax=Maritimibacter sp. DP1N21-5 TaxID=2836867 RepID=UPI001C4566B9|nr:FAD-dependent oxidoreductase [Maritimibacter sp. DP1N21-5]MBV7407522.1 FAD-binding oxidoreductase [Maritimibacter sp. DP1N21-5]